MLKYEVKSHLSASAYQETANMYPSNHKTVFVLDHTPYFGSICDSSVELDVANKPRGVSFIPLAPVQKSLWTASVESALEYCRVVWDLFPSGKYLRFVVSNSQGHVLNTWSPHHQNLAYIQNQLGGIGVPPPPTRTGSEFSVIHGLQSAAEIICQCTEIQHEKRTSLCENSSKVLNRSRVICITSQKDNASVRNLCDFYHRFVNQANKKAASTDTLMPITHCHLVIINVIPRDDACLIAPQPLFDLSPTLSCEVHVVKANGNVALKLSHLILQHYDLASTTVTGIPMKEEQNASSSANYDVEIFHRSEVHASILKGSAQDSALVRTQREGCEYDTVTLKWCTPRGAVAGEMHHCTSMHRITPVDVNSRPSSCLINFLLNGRSVMLEMPRKSGGKVLSHMLAAHGGEIFIHALGTSRSVLEDPPSISEGPGGRVTDYRIQDFGQLMKKNKLLPLKKKRQEGLDLGFNEDSPVPLDRMRQRIERYTKHWPVTISSTHVFNLRPEMDPLLNAIVKETMTDEEVLQCKQVIYGLVSQETKHEPLQPAAAGPRTKGPKRDEQYRQMWSELETLVRSHGRTDQHNAVLSCLLECRSRSDDDPKSKVERKDDKVELDQALRELDQMASSPGPTPNGQRMSVIRATTDSPMSPPPMSASTMPLSGSRNHSSRPAGHSIYSSGPRTVLDFFIAASSENKPSRPEFHGLVTSDVGPNGTRVAKLYSHLNSQEGGRDAPGGDGEG